MCMDQNGKLSHLIGEVSLTRALTTTKNRGKFVEGIENAKSMSNKAQPTNDDDDDDTSIING